MRWNFEALKTYCDEHEVELTKDYSGNNLNFRSAVEGKCKSEYCTEIFLKSFNNLILSGAYCKTCTLNHALETRKKNNLEKYGVEYNFQRPDVIEKRVKTWLDKYGVSNPSQNKESQEKFKATSIKNHGVEHPSRNAEVREKRRITCLKKFGFENPLDNDKVKTKFKERLTRDVLILILFFSKSTNEYKKPRSWDACSL